ncbi:MAG: hypothetical protein AAFR87_13410, partial [Bacteroidota bacterium]
PRTRNPYFLLFIFLFQLYQTEMDNITQSKNPIINLRKNDNRQESHEFFSLLDEKGRRLHREITGIVDMIFPFV